MLRDALARMPHSGPMRLIDDVVSADEDGILCIATDHQAASYPLRIDGILHGCVLMELGAQAAAAHASLFGMSGAHTGLVLSFGNVEIRRDRVETKRQLTVRAWQLQSLDNASSYGFEVFDGADLVVAAEVLLSMQRRSV